MVSKTCSDCGRERSFYPSNLAGRSARYSLHGGVYRCRACWNKTRRKEMRSGALEDIKCTHCHKTVRKPKGCVYTCASCRAEHGVAPRTNRAEPVVYKGERGTTEKGQVWLRDAKGAVKFQAVCGGCGKVRWVSNIEGARRLCMSCARAGVRNTFWRGGAVTLTCRECGEAKTFRKSYADNRKYREGATFLCARCISERHMEGAENPAWRGGSSFEPYPEGWKPSLREYVRNRADNKCSVCGAQQADRRGARLDVHHIDYDKNNLDVLNLVALCRTCHTKTNFRRYNWPTLMLKLAYFQENQHAYKT